MKAQMNLEDFKKEVFEELQRRVGKERANRLMMEYEPDFQMFLEKNWNPGVTATAMIAGY